MQIAAGNFLKNHIDSDILCADHVCQNSHGGNSQWAANKRMPVLHTHPKENETAVITIV